MSFIPQNVVYTVLNSSTFPGICWFYLTENNLQPMLDQLTIPGALSIHYYQNIFLIVHNLKLNNPVIVSYHQWTHLSVSLELKWTEFQSLVRQETHVNSKLLFW